MNEREPADDGDIFSQTEADIRKWFRRSVRDQTRVAFAVCVIRLVAAGEQRDDDVERRRGMSEHLNGEKRAADRPNDGVHSVPGGIDPRNFVGEKFQEVEKPAIETMTGWPRTRATGRPGESTIQC